MTCSLRVLGCSGGIGADLRTTSLLLDEHILIDAGTGVGDLSLDELRKIDHVFVTHSHLDHICSLPLMADAVGGSRDKSLKVYGVNETINALQGHIFNNVIWPDFTKIPNAQHPFISLHRIELNEPVKLGKIMINAMPVHHSIAANAYAISSATGTIVFSGDTGVSDDFWKAINQQKKIKHLIIETSFLDQEEALALISGHLCPSLLMSELSKLDPQALHPEAKIWICHLKPDGGDVIMQEIEKLALNFKPKPQKLTRNTVLEF